MDYNGPDRKAPRFRKPKLSVLDWRLYRDFKKKYPQYRGVSNRELGKIIAAYNETLKEVVTESRDGVELLGGLGCVFVASCPAPQKKNVDHKTSSEYGKVIRHRNFDSDGRLAKICYTNYTSKYKFKHRELWKFKGETAFRKFVKEVFKKNWQKYIQIDNFVRISSAFKRATLKKQTI